jgi:hypothetical protein
MNLLRLSEENSVSSLEFLHFLIKEQKESSVTLEEIQKLFERLNHQASPCDIMPDGFSRRNVKENDYYMVSRPSRKYITKSVFFHYLISELNDIFDPNAEKLEYNDMTQPLSSYWINSSHNICMFDVEPEKRNIQTYLMGFTSILQRGIK